MQGGNWRSALVMLLCCVWACRGASRESVQRDAQVRTATVIAAAQGVAMPAGFEPLNPVSDARSGALVLARTGSSGGRMLALVADADEEALIVVDADEMTEVSRYAVGGRPEHVLVGPDGLVYVTVASHARVEQLAVVNEHLVRLRATAVAADPAGMATTEDRTLLVASRWGHALSVFEMGSLELRREIPLERDPYAVALLQDGRAVVTHVVGGRVSVVDHRSGEVSVLDASRRDLKRSRARRKKYKSRLGGRRGPPRPPIPTHRRAVQGFAAARIDDGRVLVSATLADGSRPVSGGGYGGGTDQVRTQAGVELVVSPDGAGVEVPMGTARRPNVDCLLPRASAWDPHSEMLIVACAGTRRIIGVGTEHDFAGRLLWAARVPEGPVGLALDLSKRRFFVWSQFAGKLISGDLAKTGKMLRPPKTLAVRRDHPLPQEVVRGRVLFHRAGSSIKAAGDGRACASCHPSGRDDGTTWHTFGGPRQTPVLVGRVHDTAPFGWNGRSETLEEHMKTTLRRLQSSNLNATEQADLLAYVRWLQPPSVPKTDAELARAGHELFTAPGSCASCHPLGATTDGQQHDLGSQGKADTLALFNTPSLRFVARSAPYYHDGRYPTLDALLQDPTTGMGSHADLSTDDRRALVAFLRTL